MLSGVDRRGTYVVKESVEKVRLCWRKLLIYSYKSLETTKYVFWETRAKHSHKSLKRKVVEYVSKLF